MKYIDRKIIFECTNGGLDIILWKYPDAIKAIEKAGTKFKIRGDEKTPSASLKKMQDGNWVVTDFGGDQKARNGIQIEMMEDNVDFKEAIQRIADKFNITDDPIKLNLPKADFEMRDAFENEPEGEYYFQIKEKFSESEIKEIFSDKVIEAVISDARRNNKGEMPEDPYQELRKILTHYDCFSLTSFTYIKDRRALVSRSTDVYPIFMFDYGTWKKIYQPKNPEKQYRFRYVGKKEEKFIFGSKQCVSAFNDYQRQNETENMDAESEDEREVKVEKLESIILCSGERDALNVAAMHYNVVWLNSESAKLSWSDFTNIAKLCKNFYNLPDIDKTGIRQAHELAMQFLEIKTIWLPEELAEKKDFRLNPCKDLRDYLRYWTKKDFENLVKTALPYQFWDCVPMYKKNGEFIRYNYKINNVQSYNFLYRNGFGRYKQDNKKEGYIFIKIEGNIVKEIDAIIVKDFINNFLKSRHTDVNLRNIFFRSNQLSESSMSNLAYFEIDFSDFSRKDQYLFFKNRTWCINADEIKVYRPEDVRKYVWEDEVIQHFVEKLDLMFNITYDELNKSHDISILDNSCLFFKFLINTSRIYWRKELEDLPLELQWNKEQIKNYQEKFQYSIEGENLSEKEICEQKQHLVNKIYSFGYLLHRFKDPAKAWAVFAMDYKISDQGESHGGSGKSIAYKALRHFMKNVTLDGRNPRLTDNPHIYENVTKHTDYILIDDCNENLKFDFFFASITGELSVNPKNNRQSVIPFEDAAKSAFTTNFTVKNADPSTERRLLHTVFSDYYHYNKNNAYQQERKVNDDFGKNLFQDFTEMEWNYFFNFMSQCLKFYLSSPRKVNPPLEHVMKRTLISDMGDAFNSWADTYFSSEGDNLDNFVSRKDAFKNFIDYSNLKWSSNRFTKAMKAWCQLNGFIYNPKEYQNSRGRIIRKIGDLTTEMIYVQIKSTQK